MDYIDVINQEIYAYHGVLEEEKKEGQYFYLSFRAYLDMAPSAEKDAMALSVSYAAMCRTVQETVTATTYDLIETVADKVAKALLMTYPRLKKVKVTVKKPSAPIEQVVDYPAVTVKRRWHKACISVGSNLGDSVATIEGALEKLGETPFTELSATATIIETAPWGKEDQPNFYNTAAVVKTLLTPAQLMQRLLDIEALYGRKREEKWGPRTLDLDLILYDDRVSDDPFVTLPHPLMAERAFVLKPLCELVPNYVHPLLNKRLFHLLAELED